MKIETCCYRLRST